MHRTGRQRARLRSTIVVAAALTLSPIVVSACASDDPDDVEQIDDGPADEPGVPLDPTVDDGIDTEVEQSGNLGFDEEPADFDGDVVDDD